MTTLEFSNEFDTLLQSLILELPFGKTSITSFDEYEKSVFLTKALLLLIKEYFDSLYNTVKEGFDDTPKRLYDFSSLIKTTLLYNILHHWDNLNLQLLDTFNLDGIPFLLPEDFYLAINEVVIDLDNKKYSIIPLTFSLYLAKLSLPYPYPNKRQAWRIISNLRLCNTGSTVLNYSDGVDSGLVDITCATAFASGNKDMTFALECNVDLISKLDEYALGTSGVLNDTNKLILNNLLLDITNPVDSYMQIYRTINTPKLELLTCSFYSKANGTTETIVDDSGNDKLWDDDFSINYTFDGIETTKGKVNCIYLDSSAVAITAITILGESSILGALKTYLKVCRDLEYRESTNNPTHIGIDPYSIIGVITFTHWEEGQYKKHKWVCWNGEYTYKSNIGIVSIEWNSSSDDSIKIWEVPDLKVCLFNSLKELLVESNKNKTLVISGLARNYSYVGVKKTSAGGTYSNITLKYRTFKGDYSSLDPPTTTLNPFVPTDNGYDTDAAKERKNIINSRHWDNADLFKWPQRLKWKDCSNYQKNKTAQVFSVKMKVKSIPTCEVIADLDSIKTYMMRYVRIPKPIILLDLTNTLLSINNITLVSECELPQECHSEILERAVILARNSLIGNTLETSHSTNTSNNN